MRSFDRYCQEVIFVTPPNFVIFVIQKNLQTPRFLKKVFAIRKYPLYKILDFFEEKIIIDKNLIIFYVNCDSLKFHFLKNICIVLRLTFCNLSVSTFPINSFSITFIYVSPCISARHFTASRISRASDVLLQDLMLFSSHSCRQSTSVGSTAGCDVIVSESKSIYLSSVVSLKTCANNSSNSVSISSFMIDTSPISKPHF